MFCSPLFFFSHLKIVNLLFRKYSLSSIFSREAIREELKDFFGALVDKPRNNCLNECYHKWKKSSSSCQFGLLLEIVKSSYSLKHMKEIDISIIEEIKQSKSKLNVTQILFSC
uniref:Uncharacterized protein n=1 Tax=Strongyloides venezuelensis TaxID=75913 RepID=A0A0K0FS87_STRVS